MRSILPDLFFYHGFQTLILFTTKSAIAHLQQLLDQPHLSTITHLQRL